MVTTTPHRSEPVAAADYSHETVNNPIGARSNLCIVLATLTLRGAPTLAQTPVPRPQIGISRISSTCASLLPKANGSPKPSKRSDQSIKRTDRNRTSPANRFLTMASKASGGIWLPHTHFVAADKDRQKITDRHPSHAGEGIISLHSNEVAQ